VSRQRDRFCLWLCAVLSVTSVLATIPALEMGTNDDWSYAWVARELARTGHFTYNGWIGAMIGVQAWWAALLIRWFGYSFTLVRLSTLPFAAGSGILLYRLGRLAGLNPSFALFGCLSITLSPVFIPVAASFMTDVPGCFFWLASVYCMIQAAQAASTNWVWVWMMSGAVAGIAGGTVRQVVWLIPLVALPTVAWMRRTERRTIAGASLLWLLSTLAIALCLRWYNQQPYVTEMPREPEAWSDVVGASIESVLQVAVACLVLMAPVLALHVTNWRRWVRTPAPLAYGMLVAGILATGLWWFGDSPLLGNVVTSKGMLGQGLDMLGTKPEILPLPMRLLLGVALFLAAGFTVAAQLADYRRLAGPFPEPMRQFLWIVAPSSVFYALAVLYRSVRDWLLFDRYCILLLPLLVVPLLWHFQQRIRETPPVWGWIVMALFACFGIALTHDYLAAGRARVIAADTITHAGIPRTHVSAGLEYDGWTQLEQSGRIPSPTEQAATPARRFPVSPPFWFWTKTPSVEPQYVVTYSRLKGLVDSSFPPLDYTAWLPPFHREVLIQKLPE